MGQCQPVSGFSSSSLDKRHGKPERKKKRLVVHLGLRKVATTSIQAWLQENSGLLKEKHNILVLVRHDLLEDWREIVYAYMNDQISREEFIRNCRRETYKFRRRAQAQDEDTILISDENLFGARLYKYERDGSITTLCDWASWILPVVEASWKDQFDLSFVLYTRTDEDAWIQSCYNQEVKNNQVTLRYEEWVSRIPAGERRGLGVRFESLPQQLQCPSSLRIVPLGTEAQLGSTLLKEAGVDPTSPWLVPPPTQKLNESLPQAALDFMRAINAFSDIPQSSKASVGAVVAEMRHVFVASMDGVVGASIEEPKMDNAKSSLSSP